MGGCCGVLLVVEMSCRGSCHACPCREQISLDLQDMLVQATNALDIMNRSKVRISMKTLNDFRTLVKRSKIVIQRSRSAF